MQGILYRRRASGVVACHVCGVRDLRGGRTGSRDRRRGEGESGHAPARRECTARPRVLEMAGRGRDRDTADEPTALSTFVTADPHTSAHGSVTRPRSRYPLPASALRACGPAAAHVL